jgi:hypothetical protein
MGIHSAVRLHSQSDGNFHVKEEMWNRNGFDFFCSRYSTLLFVPCFYLRMSCSMILLKVDSLAECCVGRIREKVTKK